MDVSRVDVERELELLLSLCPAALQHECGSSGHYGLHVARLDLQRVGVQLVGVGVGASLGHADALQRRVARPLQVLLSTQRDVQRGRRDGDGRTQRAVLVDGVGHQQDAQPGRVEEQRLSAQPAQVVGRTERDAAAPERTSTTTTAMDRQRVVPAVAEGEERLAPGERKEGKPYGTGSDDGSGDGDDSSEYGDDDRGKRRRSSESGGGQRRCSSRTRGRMQAVRWQR